MNDSATKKKFLALQDYDDLAQMLGLTVNGLRRFRHSTHYKIFAISKKTGGYRMISSPEGALKTIQRKLAAILLEVYGGRATVHGFAAKRSIKSNAQQHVGRRHVFNIDLADFFPTIHYGRVRGLFESKPYGLPYGIAEALAQLTCHLGSLPQGAPTSPIISNLICGGLDAKLKSLARANNCRYTRYADDITFSCDSANFPTDIASFDGTKWVPGQSLEAEIAKEGFKVNQAKTSMRIADNRQMVTGLVVNEKVNVTGTYLKSVRGMLWALEMNGLAKAQLDFHARYETKQSVAKGKNFQRVLAGRVNYIGFIKGWDSNAYLSLAGRLQIQGIVLRKRPVQISATASDRALYQAQWIVDGGLSKEYAVDQSSGFSWGKHGIVTAAHSVGEYDKSGKWTKFDYVQVRQPHLGSGITFPVKIIAAHPHADIALLEYPVTPLVSLAHGLGATVSQRDIVRILGFPHYHDGDSCTDQDFVVNASRIYSGVQHRIVVGSIIRGNSGGPVLNKQNHVVGVALKGQQIPAHFSDKDALSSFAIAETLDLLLGTDPGLVKLP
jgi:S1-C subfamily serine protease